MVDEQSLIYGIRGILSGRVQGVGFRAFVKREALNRNIQGRAINLHDGRLEVVFWGDRKTLDELQSVIAQGPPSAKVTNLAWEPYQEESFEGFIIG
jgi:acylphosphatase